MSKSQAEKRHLEARSEAWNEIMGGVNKVLVLAALQELGVFQFLTTAGPQNAVEIARSAEISASRLSPWLDCVVELGFLCRTGDQYMIVPGDEPLFQDDSPWRYTLHFAPSAKMFGDAAMAVQRLRENKWQVAAGSGESQSLEERERFLAFLDTRSRDVATEVAGILSTTGKTARMLDLGGGAGTYSIALLKNDPQSSAEVIERETARGIALRQASEAEVAERFTFTTADMFSDELPGNQDVVLCSNLLHIYGATQCQQLIQRAAATLRPGGRLAIKDFHIAEDLAAPASAVWFRLNMSRVTENGSVYPAMLIAQWMKDAGLNPGHCFALRQAPESFLLLGTKP